MPAKARNLAVISISCYRFALPMSKAAAVLDALGNAECVERICFRDNTFRITSEKERPEIQMEVVPATRILRQLALPGPCA